MQNEESTIEKRVEKKKSTTGEVKEPEQERVTLCPKCRQPTPLCDCRIRMVLKGWQVPILKETLWDHSVHNLINIIKKQNEIDEINKG